ATPTPTTGDTTASAAASVASGRRPARRGVGPGSGAGNGSAGSGATVSRSGSTCSLTVSRVGRPHRVSGRGEPAPTGHYGQPRQPSMSSATTAPGGGSAVYTGYFCVRSTIAAERSAPPSRTRPSPSNRTHHSVDQSSE